MATKEFKKEDFTQNQSGEYSVEYKTEEIGQGSNLIIEEKISDGEYQVVQVPVRRQNDSIFIIFSEPVDGRLIIEK
ncbi:glutathione synthase [Chryseobacterium sp. Leaf404]|uniref:hypothetical protein n=1 Tax=unclassified Chryseobacterium TaxID=2593645 RepID=UPI0006F70E6A|nr:MULTISPECIES: hypothetical protein [unclassified Chryseobacterium]KQT18622.1 glutathione synthase [Chryseobacterium sp. Leaf404]